MLRLAVLILINQLENKQTYKSHSAVSLTWQIKQQ